MMNENELKILNGFNKNTNEIIINQKVYKIRYTYLKLESGNSVFMHVLDMKNLDIKFEGEFGDEYSAENKNMKK